MAQLQNILGIGTLVLALTACENQEQPSPKPYNRSELEIDRGKILDKRYEPEREYTKQEPVYTVGDGTPCFIIPVVKYIDDEDFIITYRDYEYPGVGIRSTSQPVYVSKEVYDSLKIGDLFDISKTPLEFSDPETTSKNNIVQCYTF